MGCFSPPRRVFAGRPFHKFSNNWQGLQCATFVIGQITSAFYFSCGIYIYFPFTIWYRFCWTAPQQTVDAKERTIIKLKIVITAEAPTTRPTNVITSGSVPGREGTKYSQYFQFSPLMFSRNSGSMFGKASDGTPPCPRGLCVYVQLV